MADWIDRTPPANDIPIEGSWDTITPHERFVWLMWGLFIIVAFLLRKTPLGFLWRWVQMFFVALLVVVVADHAKKSVKDWWNKN